MCVLPDFDMSPDGCVRRLNKLKFLSILLEIPVFGPLFSLVGMTMSCPRPQPFPDLGIQPSEETFGNNMSVIIGPPPDDRVQQTDDGLLRQRPGFLQDVPDLSQKCLHIVT